MMEYAEESQKDDSDDSNWILSFADLMTQLFAMFVMLFSFSTIDDKKMSHVTESLSDSFKNERKPSSSAQVVSNFTEEKMAAFDYILKTMNVDVKEMVDQVKNLKQQKINSSSAQNIILTGLQSDINNLQGITIDSSHNKESIVEFIIPVDILISPHQRKISPKAKSLLRDISEEISAVQGLASIEIIGFPSKTISYNNISKYTELNKKSIIIARELKRNGISQNKISMRIMSSPYLSQKSNKNIKKPREQVHIAIKKINKP